MCQFKEKDLEIKPYPLCLRNISKGFTLDDMKKKKKKKKTGLKGSVQALPIDYDPINTSGILDIHRFLIRERIA